MYSQNATHPSRWRETCDPFALPFRHFQLRKILGYPHARNDVFHVIGNIHGQETIAYIKSARQNTDSAIDNEVNVLLQLDDPIFPKVLDHGEHGTFSVTTAMPGERLSSILGENKEFESLSYMEEYGETLSRIHSMNVSAKPQADRKYRHRPNNEILEKLNLRYLTSFFDNEPTPSPTVFCHGDFHYANVLWEKHHISAVLDFELSGYGNRDFDIAWALFLRPGQRFLKTQQEQDLFLKGYQKNGEYDINAVKYYMAQCYVYFLYYCDDNREYEEYIRNWLKNL